MGTSPDGSTYSDVPSDYILVQGNADLKDGWVEPRIWTTQVTKTAEAGDLIMSVRAPAGAMGKTAYNAVIGRGVAAIKGNEFIFQSLVKMDIEGYWKKLSAGSTFDSLNTNVINEANINMRELYFKPFEICVKEGGSTSVMSSFNRIGTKWTGGDYRLLTQVLREEWGFNGTVITDFNVNSYMNLKQMLYAGGDLNLASQGKKKQLDVSNANDAQMIQRAAKNILYTVANSNALNVTVTGYKMAYWQIAMWCIEGVLGAGIVTWGILAFLHAKKKMDAETKQLPQE